MYKMLFNTGVRTYNHLDKHGNLIEGIHEVWKDNQLHIAFYLEREPEPGLILLCLAPADYLETMRESQVAIKIVDGGMLSDYAIFVKV